MVSELLKLNDISKSFPGVKALQGVNLTLNAGEVHALVGENGAGKSTLVKVICGIYTPDEGEIYYKNKEVKFSNPSESKSIGISIIHQELNLIKEMTIAENIFLGSEIKNKNSVIINNKEMYREADELLKQVGLDKSPLEKIKNLSVGEQQMVEIAKSLSQNVEVLILDEPTAALTKGEIDNLFKLINSLKGKGVGMIYISHRMDEIFNISDNITVLRDGEYIDTLSTNDTDLNTIINLMVGREMGNYYPRKTNNIENNNILEVKEICIENEIENVSFNLKKGEVLGIAGLMGSGRTEIAKALFGAKKLSSGSIHIDGKDTRIISPASAIKNGIHLVTEDRKDEGLIIENDIYDNTMLPNWKKAVNKILIDSNKASDEVYNITKKLNVKTPSINQKLKNLSGGNQQKVVLSKWLVNIPKILILDEPTRGIDVAAKYEIYEIINKLSSQGISIIVISSELPELLGITDRIIVMHEGKTAGEFKTELTSQEEIMYAATGGK